MIISLLTTEISLITLALLGQLLALFKPNQTRSLVMLTSILCLITAIYSYLAPHSGAGFLESFINDNNIYKPLVILLTSASLLLYASYRKEFLSFEFATLMILASVGICLAISSRHFLLLFCGLELQSLCGYALTIIGSSNPKASEAALKYLILGALMSAISLLGISFIYGATGSLYFDAIANYSDNLILTAGLVLMSSYVLFKLAAAPIHIWLMDVYEGSSVAAVSFFAVAQKLGMVIVLINLIKFALIGQWSSFLPLLQVLAVLSMIIGAGGAITQSSFKRLMAYSSILNIGYVLMVLTIGDEHNFRIAILYIIIYIVSVLGLFACTYFVYNSQADQLMMRDLRGLGNKKPLIALSMSILALSNIGLPPLAGFIGKYYLFIEMIKYQSFKLLALAVVVSFASAYYYLRIIKTVYFENGEIMLEAENNSEANICNLGLKVIIVSATAFSIIGFILPVETLISYF